MKVQLVTSCIKVIGQLDTARMRNLNKDRKLGGEDPVTLDEYVAFEAQRHNFLHVDDDGERYAVAARHVVTVKHLTDVSDL
jgi:hypothetical protein